MVCVPCILLPFIVALYLKFIQPIILRLVPEAWRTTFDAVLYPTCPIAPPPPAEESKDSKQSEEPNDDDGDENSVADDDKSVDDGENSVDDDDKNSVELYSAKEPTNGDSPARSGAQKTGNITEDDCREWLEGLEGARGDGSRWKMD